MLDVAFSLHEATAAAGELAKGKSARTTVRMLATVRA
jgi:hypothetical protein